MRTIRNYKENSMPVCITKQHGIGFIPFYQATVLVHGVYARLKADTVAELIETLDAIWGDAWYDCDQSMARSNDSEIREIAYR